MKASRRASVLLHNSQGLASAATLGATAWASVKPTRQRDTNVLLRSRIATVLRRLPARCAPEPASAADNGDAHPLGAGVSDGWAVGLPVLERHSREAAHGDLMF